jgi:glycosyltransferase involved in cell wall biosynthesis
LSANGFQSILYDIWSLVSATRQGSNRILLLGVSGAIVLPLLRLFSKARIVTNIDGIEWRREKWGWSARWFLRLSERLAVRYSHAVVADNGGIADYIRETYGCSCNVIAYGGDHAIAAEPSPYHGKVLPDRYALALCRIEPENNVHVILEAFSNYEGLPLVFIGNWQNSGYGRDLQARYGGNKKLHLLDPVYDVGVLRSLRGGASVYVHGHSAGGTNPSLVEMMHFGIPILAYDCVFNRYTTENKAFYFSDAQTLRAALRKLGSPEYVDSAEAMKRIAQERYTWEAVGTAYFDLLMKS